MATPKIPDLIPPAKNFARLVFLIIIIVIFVAIIKLGRDFLISKNIFRNSVDNKEVFVDNLKFDYKITKVVDGDTIYVERLDGGKVEGISKEMKVRLIGINTPESVDPRRPVECFGEEASDYVKSIADGKVAAIEIDKSQAKFDNYQRLLGYVFVKKSGIYPNNVVFINEEILKNGYAYEYTYNTPYKYQREFKKLEMIAKNKHEGLWAQNTCNGLKKPVSTPPEA